MKHELTGAEKDKQEFWRQHVRAWEQSGLSQKAYCEDQALCLSVFGYWKRKLGFSEHAAPRFYPLAVAAPPVSEKTGSAGLHVHLKDDRFRIEVKPGFSAALLREIVVALEQL